MSKSDDLNTPMVALVGVVGALVVFVMIVGLQVWFYNLEEVETYKKDISLAPEELGNLVTEQQTQLYSYRWVDPQKRVVGIPIDRAMELVVRDLSMPTTGTASATTRTNGHAK